MCQPVDKLKAPQPPAMTSSCSLLVIDLILIPDLALRQSVTYGHNVIRPPTAWPVNLLTVREKERRKEERERETRVALSFEGFCSENTHMYTHRCTQTKACVMNTHAQIYRQVQCSN